MVASIVQELQKRRSLISAQATEPVCVCVHKKVCKLQDTTHGKLAPPSITGFRERGWPRQDGCF